MVSWRIESILTFLIIFLNLLAKIIQKSQIRIKEFSFSIKIILFENIFLRKQHWFSNHSCRWRIVRIILLVLLIISDLILSWGRNPSESIWIQWFFQQKFKIFLDILWMVYTYCEWHSQNPDCEWDRPSPGICSVSAFVVFRHLFFFVSGWNSGAAKRLGRCLSAAVSVHAHKIADSDVAATSIRGKTR